MLDPQEITDYMLKVKNVNGKKVSLDIVNSCIQLLFEKADEDNDGKI